MRKYMNKQLENVPLHLVETVSDDDISDQEEGQDFVRAKTNNNIGVF